MIKNFLQPEIIKIEEQLRLRKPLISEWEIAVSWYQNKDIMYYSEGMVDRFYNCEDINRMYSYLSEIGELYFIEVFNDKWKPIGDVTLAESNFPIVIAENAYWGKGIGKKVIGKLIERARDIGMAKITIPEIYHYNERSKNLFISMGFVKIDEDERSQKFELLLIE